MELRPSGKACHQRCAPCTRMFTATSVVDRWHFRTDTDPQVRTTDLRIRILLFFVNGGEGANKKYVWFSKFFCFLPFEGTFISAFIGKKYKKVTKLWISRIFLLFFAYWWKDPDPYKSMTVLDPGGPKTHGSRSTTLLVTLQLTCVSSSPRSARWLPANSRASSTLSSLMSSKRVPVF